MLQNGGEEDGPKSVYLSHPDMRQIVADEHRFLSRGRIGEKRRKRWHHGRFLSAYDSSHHDQ